VDRVLVGRKLRIVVSTAAAALFVPASVPALGTPGANSPKMAILHATITVTGGISFTGTFDDPLPLPTCADVVKRGTILPGSGGVVAFYVPSPPATRDGNPGPVSGGHTFMTDAAALPYHGPGTYTGSGLNATQMDVDTRPNDQETHIFAFPTGVGTMIINPDASGSFQFSGLQDPSDVRISGQVVWTCS
jgi:hypothetical protein